MEQIKMEYILAIPLLDYSIPIRLLDRSFH